MIRLQWQLISECYNPMTRIQSLMSEIHKLAPEQREQLLAALQSGDTQPGVEQIPSDIAEVVEWQAAAKVLVRTDDQQRLARACDELRMKLVLVAMTADPVRKLATATNKVESLYALEGDTNEFANLPIIANRGGVISATFSHFYTVILLPRVDDESTQDEVSAGLHEIYERMGSQPSWIIDFSQVSTVPYGLLGNIMGYRHLLNSRSGEMHICWLRANALPPSAAERVTGLLSLRSIGEFWFSQGTSSSAV